MLQFFFSKLTKRGKFFLLNQKSIKVNPTKSRFSYIALYSILAEYFICCWVLTNCFPHFCRYQSMLRILKKYILPFRRTGASEPEDINPGHTVTFSSYPGLLSSGDDYYILSSGLVTLETTIGNGNPALWKNVSASGEVSIVTRKITFKEMVL